MDQTRLNVKETKQSLLAEAFGALLEQLGPEKTTQIWQVLSAPHDDYLDIRPSLFVNKNGEDLDREIEKFNLYCS